MDVSSSIDLSWDSPLSGSVKPTVDGVARHNKTGSGGTLKEKSGNIRIMFSGPLPPLDSDYAELMTIFFALDFFRRRIGLVQLI
ncbi:hypothetical protein V6N13_135332 [Hibiscus sabdariffa]